MSGLADWITQKYADLARPTTLYAMAGSAAWATIETVKHVTNGLDGAAVLGAIGVTLSALYAGRALENASISKHTAQVEVERAKATPPPTTALAPATEPESGEDPAMYGGPRE